MTPKQTLTNAMETYGITVDAVFVPWSKSRDFKQGAKVRERSLNWIVTVRCKDRLVLTTNYSAGIGHCPGYKNQVTQDVASVIEFETEHGKAGWVGSATGHTMSRSPVRPIMPDPCDVMFSLISDANVLNHPTFEDWASDIGYDADSRFAERIYRACLDIALKLRATLGDSALTALQLAAQDY